MDEYGQMVVRIAFTYMKEQQAAEDIAQDVFIKCFQKMDTFRNESSYKTWIYKITVNRCKDMLRSKSVINIFKATKFMGSTEKYSPSSEIEVVLRERERWIAERILALPIKLRECIVLFYYEELRIEEIAELLNINQNTVKSRLYRARQKLKTLIGGEGDE
ncbi:sigma-70 family RNA polymerase sigma factor [Aquibacillus koreensis]